MMEIFSLIDNIQTLVLEGGAEEENSTCTLPSTGLALVLHKFNRWPFSHQEAGHFSDSLSTLTVGVEMLKVASNRLWFSLNRTEPCNCGLAA